MTTGEIKNCPLFRINKKTPRTSCPGRWTPCYDFSNYLSLFLAPAEPLIEERKGRRFNTEKWLKKKERKKHR
jgi:hypothetical protein